MLEHSKINLFRAQYVRRVNGGEEREISVFLLGAECVQMAEYFRNVKSGSHSRSRSEHHH